MQIKKVDFILRRDRAMEKLPKRGFAKMIHNKYPDIKLMTIYNVMNQDIVNIRVLEALEELAGIKNFENK